MVHRNRLRRLALPRQIGAKPLRVINEICGAAIIFYGLKLLLNGLAMFL